MLAGRCGGELKRQREPWERDRPGEPEPERAARPGLAAERERGSCGRQLCRLEPGGAGTGLGHEHPQQRRRGVHVAAGFEDDLVAAAPAAVSCVPAGTSTVSGAVSSSVITTMTVLARGPRPVTPAMRNCSRAYFSRSWFAR